MRPSPACRWCTGERVSRHDPDQRRASRRTTSAASGAAASSATAADIINPATSESLGSIALAEQADVTAAVEARPRPHSRSGGGRRRRNGFSTSSSSSSCCISTPRRSRASRRLENGKTLGEARAELQRGIENVEVACGIPTLMQGYNLEDVASGIDEMMIRQPLGVTAAITPFNFPAMIPLWFLPYALACGNTFILKPSERVPLTARRRSSSCCSDRLAARRCQPCHRRQAGGGRVAGASGSQGDLFCRLERRRQIHLFRRRRARQARAVPGRRQEPRGRHARRGSGDDREDRQRQRLRLRRPALPGRRDGDYGGRGVAQRFRRRCVDLAGGIRVGNGLDDGVEMGPVITAAEPRADPRPHRQGRSGWRQSAARWPANAIRRSGGWLFHEADRHQRDRRGERADHDGDFWAGAVAARGGRAWTRRSTSSPAIRTETPRRFSRRAARPRGSSVTRRRPATSASTSALLRRWRTFPFSGWKDSFLGVLHGQGRDGVEFYTDKKVVVERWPKEWSRKF